MSMKATSLVGVLMVVASMATSGLAEPPLCESICETCNGGIVNVLSPVLSGVVYESDGATGIPGVVVRFTPGTLAVTSDGTDGNPVGYYEYEVRDLDTGGDIRAIPDHDGYCIPEHTFPTVVDDQTHDFLAQHVTITSPGVGAEFVGGQPINISWTLCNNVGILDQELYYNQTGDLSDPGAWGSIASGLSPTLTSYIWTAPLVNSGNVYVRTILNLNTGETVEILSPSFEICDGVPYPAFIDPDAGDTYEIGENMTIRVAVTNFCAEVLWVDFYVCRSGASCTDEEYIGRDYPGGEIALFNWAVTGGATNYGRIKAYVIASTGELGTAVSGAFQITDGGGCRKCDDVAMPGSGLDAMPAQTRLTGNLPNPFNPTTVVQYELARTEMVEIQIYNVAGRLVESYRPGTQAAGRYGWEWDGRDRGGREVGSGVYFVRFRAGDYTSVKKAVLMK